jgi:hypothetical protein
MQRSYRLSPRSVAEGHACPRLVGEAHASPQGSERLKVPETPSGVAPETRPLV